MAQTLIASTHHELVLASADALTREISPSGGTIIGFDPSHEPEIEIACNNPRLVEQYDRLVPTNIETGALDDPYLPFVRMGFGMRIALQASRDDHAAARAITYDIAALAGLYFDVQRRIDRERHALEPNDQWLEFTGYVRGFLDELNKDEMSPGSLIQATRILNAVHTGDALMLQRFTRDGRKYDGLKEALIAADEPTHDRLLACSGYLGSLLHEYLTGRNKSLTRLPTGKPVPDNFKSLA